MQIITSSKDRQSFWEKKRDKKLEEIYSIIAKGIPLVDIRNKKAFYDGCSKYFTELIKIIDRMFGKGLNPTSLKSALNDIQFFVKNLNSSDEFLRIVEFGPGSGWSTLMLHNQIKREFPNKIIQFISVDVSPHSIVATQNSLDYYQILWQTILENKSIDSIPNTDSHITLVLDNFLDFIKKQPDNYFNGFFSSHGTTYLSKLDYQELITTLIQKGKNNAIFVTDSLDPVCAVELSTSHLLSCSIFPQKAKNMDEYYYGKSSMSNSKYFTGQEVKKLVKVNNEESLLFYEWNHYLITHFRFLYLINMIKSIKITTDVINEYLEDVYPSYLIRDLKLCTDIGCWKELDNLPKVPLYISNAGFILKKL